MGFSSLIPKTVGRSSIDNIVVPRELLRIVREKEHRFPSFLALWSKKEGRDYSPKELPLCINMARKCKKNEKKHEKQPFELMLGRSQGGRSQGESEKQKIFRSHEKKHFFVLIRYVAPLGVAPHRARPKHHLTTTLNMCFLWIYWCHQLFAQALQARSYTCERSPLTKDEFNFSTQ